MGKKEPQQENASDLDKAIDNLVKRNVAFCVERINEDEHVLKSENKERKFDKAGALVKGTV